jgi:NADH dehydrogenase
MGRPAPTKLHIPLGLLRLTVPAMQRSPRFPLTTDQMQMLIEESICDGGWKATFGFEPRGFGNGIAEYLGKGRSGTGTCPERRR